MSGKTVSINSEWLLNRIQALERVIADIRAEAAKGVYKPASNREEKDSPFVRVAGQPESPAASPAGINIHDIDWRDKNSDEVGPEVSWAWAFAFNQNGTYKPESKALVQEIERYEKVEIDGYELTISGNDKNFLNRKKIKSPER